MKAKQKNYTRSRIGVGPSGSCDPYAAKWDLAFGKAPKTACAGPGAHQARDKGQTACPSCGSPLCPLWEASRGRL